MPRKRNAIKKRRILVDPWEAAQKFVMSAVKARSKTTMATVKSRLNNRLEYQPQAGNLSYPY